MFICQIKEKHPQVYGCFKFYSIHFCGHFEIHAPQPVHFCGSISAKKSVTVMAPASQFLAQIPQPMQEALHTFLEIAPLSLLLQRTVGLKGNSIMLIIPLGQAEAQPPQPPQISKFICGKPFLIVMALKSQARIQSPRPRHPKEQSLGPPAMVIAEAQEVSPE